MRRILLVAVFVITLAQIGSADDLYKINLNSQAEAQALENTGVEPLLWVDGGYLVLADRASGERLVSSNLQMELLAEVVSRNELALDGRRDRKNAAMFEVLYEAEGVRILRTDRHLQTPQDEPLELFPIRNEYITIEYHPDFREVKSSIAYDAALDDLLALVSQDSLYAHVCSLQAYPYRVPGSHAYLDARDWTFDKFVEYGYDSVFVDTFFSSVECYNVIACKPGSVYPERQVIIGAHLDAVLASPGADDNASGVAAVLEIARLLKDVDLPVTLIFIAFDAEEVGLLGAYDYVGKAVARGDDIVFMENMDMIAALGNDHEADLYHGPERAYAILWDQLARQYADITGYLSGTTTRSDHYPFQAANFDVCFSWEHVFSTVYHTYRDSIAFMDFDYMTRMVKANLATAYVVSKSPRPVVVSRTRQGGDGQSIQVNWLPTEWADLSHFEVASFPSNSPSEIQYTTVSAADTCCLVTGLIEGVEYGFFVQAVDHYSLSSLPFYSCAYAIPSSRPVPPDGIAIMPVRLGISLTWEGNNDELDFDHYTIVRDGEIAGQGYDTFYVDNDASLGAEYHSYHVMSTDIDGIHSDTVGLDPFIMRPAILDSARILAVNRSSVQSVDFVDETETGAFMREALEGYNFEYYSDTAATTKPYAEIQFDLVDMIDYGLMVVGAEAAKWDDIGTDPYWNGILDTMAYYMSIGGKVIVFGRWGNIVECDTVDYLANGVPYDDAYHDYFHIDYRVQTTTEFPFLSTVVTSDLVGARSKDRNYPDLVWDSLATLAHANSGAPTITEVSGIPCGSFVSLTSKEPEVLYTYDCRGQCQRSGKRTVGWKYIGDDYSYIYFDIPLSCFERATALEALRQAVTDLMDGEKTSLQSANGPQTPHTFALHQNYPNPFNPETEICYSLPSAAKVNLSIFNILGQKVVTLIDGDQVAGSHTVQWQGTDDSDQSVATGIYLYRLTAGEFTESKKMMLLK